jgi:hypothetical protein
MRVGHGSSAVGNPRCRRRSASDATLRVLGCKAAAESPLTKC